MMKVTYLDDVGIDSYQTLSEWESCIKEFLSAYDVLSSVADVSYLFDKAIYIKDVALSLKMTNWLRGNSETAAQFKRAMEKWTAIELPKNSKTTSIYKSGANEVSGTVQAEAYEDAVIAYMINKNWFKKEIISCPNVNDDTSYKLTKDRHKIAMITDIDRDKIYEDLFKKLGE